MPRLVYHFSYPESPSQGRPRLHDLRDGDAFAELMAPLYDHQFRYGGLLFNFPDPTHTLRPQDFDPSDLIVLSTRPPLNDDEFDRKYIRRSGTPMESAILNAVHRYFDVCRRSRITLAKALAPQLKFLNRGEINFTMHQGAYYRRHRTPYISNREEHRWQYMEEGEVKTAAFLLLTKLTEAGPTLLTAFGMDGNSTLIWCYLLRTKYPDLLRSERFVMAEITAAPLPQRPHNLSFADDWQVDFLLNLAEA